MTTFDYETGNINIDTTTLTVDPELNRVGIGTTTPSNKSTTSAVNPNRLRRSSSEAESMELAARTEDRSDCSTTTTCSSVLRAGPPASPWVQSRDC